MLAGALGCGGADKPPGSPPGSPDFPERLVAIDSLGSTQGDDSFGFIVDVALSPEGALAVAQHGLGEVWVFDARGRRQIVGRRGEGPGEFGFVPAVAWRGDTLVVVDGSRVSLMASDGRYLRGHTTVPSVAAVRYGSAGYLHSGLTVAAPRRMASSTAEANPILLFGTENLILDSLGEARQRRVSVNAMLAPGNWFTFQHPLPNFTRTALSPDGRYFAVADEHEVRDGSELQFTLYDDTGKELGRTAVNVETDPASDDDVLVRVGDIIESLSKANDLSVASVRRSILDAVQLPDRLPALSSFLLDDAGKLWVGSIDKSGSVVWRSWSIEGDLLRTWVADPDLEVKQIHDKGAVAIRRDDVRGWRVVFLRPRGAV